MIEKLKLVISFITIIFLSGCFEQEIIINNNLSGQIIYRVTYYNEFDKFIGYLEDKKNIDLNTQLLFDKNKLYSYINNIQGIKINNYDASVYDDYKSITAGISFNEISKMPEFLPSYFFPIKLYETNGVVYCSMILNLKNINKNVDIREIYEKLNADEKRNIDKYLLMMKLKFIFKTENQINSTNLGKLENNRKTLSFETSIYDLLNTRSNLEISFYYNKK
jgi:hypothetical protein